MNWIDFFEYLFDTIIVAVVLGLIFAYPTMLLWNWLMPMIFGLPKLTFWQVYGFSILLNLLIPHSTNTKVK